jgi:hypothetical protein
MKTRLVGVFGILLLLDFVLLVVMLVTDKNLQTNFGTVSPYYLHWYGVLALAVLTLLFAIAVLGSLRPSMAKASMFARNRYSLIGAMIWTWLVIVAMVTVVATYKQVGASSASQFAHYLFGVSAYPGVLSYIPWLYDLLLALFILSAIVGVVAVLQSPKTAPEPATGST